MPIGMMVGLESVCLFAVSGGGGRDDLRAASALSMLNGRNLVFLCFGICVFENACRWFCFEC
jgi:hypothetical protein